MNLGGLIGVVRLAVIHSSQPWTRENDSVRSPSFRPSASVAAPSVVARSEVSGISVISGSAHASQNSEVAGLITQVPPAALELCGGLGVDAADRAQRAWEAGLCVLCRKAGSKNQD